jgi:DNA-binding MarR family transcriptional regulator
LSETPISKDDVSAPIQTTGRQDLAAEVSTFLRHLHGLNMSIVQQLSPILEERQGIDLRLYYILHNIDNGAVHPGAIAQVMKLPNSLITKHLDQLAAKELLERSIDAHDSRRILIKLTKKGAELMHAADAILAELVGRRLARIADEQRANFLTTLVALAGDSEKK